MPDTSKTSPTQRDTRIVIIGGGIAGAATACSLAERGFSRMLILEKEETPGYHATGRNAALIRHLTTPSCVAEAARVSSSWLAGTGVPFSRVGSILMGREGDIEDLLAAQDESGNFQRLDTNAMETVLTPLIGTGTEAAVRCPSDGVVDVAALLDHFLSRATDAGAVLRTNTEVLGFDVTGHRVESVRTSQGNIPADVVVNAAGAWSTSLAQQAGACEITCSPLRRHLFWTGHLEGVNQNAPFVWDISAEWYLRPESGGLLLCACDTDPFEPCDAPVNEEVLESLREKLGQGAPRWADVPIARSWAGLRTFAPDHAFVVGWDPALSGFFWVAGLGGHGITCARAVGETAAQTIMSGPGTSTGPMDPARFKDGYNRVSPC